VRLIASWLNPDTVTLAGHIYFDRLFELDRMSMLADVLQDSGCKDENLLGHLRGLGPHVKGCWAVDLLLGKQ
jgi:hypothetical protein